MNQYFWAHLVGMRDAKAAYPLVYMYDATVTLESWLRFVRRRCSRPPERTGLVAIKDIRGIVHAVFGYRVDIDLQARKRLCLNNLVVARMPGSLVDEAVIQSASDLAARFSCQTISLEQPFGKPVKPSSLPVGIGDLATNQDDIAPVATH